MMASLRSRILHLGFGLRHGVRTRKGLTSPFGPSRVALRSTVCLSPQGRQ